MLKKLGYMAIILGLVISYPLAAGMAPEDGSWARASKIGTLKVAVDPDTGITYTEIEGSRPEKGYGECSPDLALDMETICPTCGNCPHIDPPNINEILLLCFCFDPSDPAAKVMPTAGQKYGFELTNPQYFGSAVDATAEVVCHQEPPTVGYEFAAKYHCAAAISVEVNSCEHFEVWYDVMGTVSP